MAESLKSSGLRTGLFVSPHLASFRERMQINGELISEDDVVRYLPRVMNYCALHQVPLTLFELTFILASLYFEGAGCDVVVLEVGVVLFCCMQLLLQLST
jgi:dihydrofolate synthase/folylpolyglutamate synthase